MFDLSTVVTEMKSKGGWWLTTVRRSERLKLGECTLFNETTTPQLVYRMAGRNIILSLVTGSNCSNQVFFLYTQLHTNIFNCLSIFLENDVRMAQTVKDVRRRTLLTHETLWLGFLRKWWFRNGHYLSLFSPSVKSVQVSILDWLRSGLWQCPEWWPVRREV